MSDDNAKHFPNRMIGMRAQPGTLDSDAHPSNPIPHSLRGLLIKRRSLINLYGLSDGSVREVEREIAERVAAIADGTPHED